MEYVSALPTIHYRFAHIITNFTVATDIAIKQKQKKKKKKKKKQQQKTKTKTNIQTNKNDLLSVFESKETFLSAKILEIMTKVSNGDCLSLSNGTPTLFIFISWIGSNLFISQDTWSPDTINWYLSHIVPEKTKGPRWPYIAHLNHVIHSIAIRDAVL